MAVGIYLVTLVASQTASMGMFIALHPCFYFTNPTLGGSVWLKEWSETNQETGVNEHVGKFLGIYFAFGVGASALSVVQTLVLWIFCSIEVGSSL